MVFSALSYDFYVKTIWFMRLFHMVLLWCGVYRNHGTDPVIILLLMICRIPQTFSHDEIWRAY